MTWVGRPKPQRIETGARRCKRKRHWLGPVLIQRGDLCPPCQIVDAELVILVELLGFVQRRIPHAARKDFHVGQQERCKVGLF